MLLFLYGSLLDPDLRARYGSTPSLRARATSARLLGWDRAALHGSRWPTLRRRRRGEVEGVVVRVGVASAARLAAWEGDAYQLRRVIVRVGQRHVPAFAWIAPGATSRPWTHPHR